LEKPSDVFLGVIPNSVLRVTTFLFANVTASVIRALAPIRFTRRERFIPSAALAFGAGNLLKSDIFGHLFEDAKNLNKGLQGLFDSITIILSRACQSLGVNFFIILD
jgi:xanthine/uracil permease